MQKSQYVEELIPNRTNIQFKQINIKNSQYMEK